MWFNCYLFSILYTFCHPFMENENVLLSCTPFTRTHTHTHTLSLFLTHCFFPSLSSPPPTYAPHIVITWASQMVQWSTQMVKIYPPAMQEMWVQSLNQEDPLEEGTVTHSSILAWRIPWTEDPSRLQSMGSQRVRTQLKWLSMPVCIIIT